jgi:uncharacterized protein DUF4333
VRPLRRFVVTFALALLTLAGCGGGGDDNAKTSGGGGSERTAVESAARSYIVQQQSDETDTERPNAISFESVQVSGDTAEVKAKSSLTGNKYTATLRKQGGTWAGLTLLTNRPGPPAGGGGNPGQGAGKTVSTDRVESQIESSLLKALGLSGKVNCPPTIKLRRGNNFECQVTGGTRKATVKVTQKDDQGSLNYKVTVRR